VIVNKSTKINKMNNHLSPKLIEYKKKIPGHMMLFVIFSMVIIDEYDWLMNLAVLSSLNCDEDINWESHNLSVHSFLCEVCRFIYIASIKLSLYFIINNTCSIHIWRSMIIMLYYSIKVQVHFLSEFLWYFMIFVLGAKIIFGI